MTDRGIRQDKLPPNRNPWWPYFIEPKSVQDVEVSEDAKNG